MTLEQMIETIDAWASQVADEYYSMSPGRKQVFKEAKSIVEAIKLAQKLHDSLHVYMRATVHGERQYGAIEMVDNMQAVQSYLAWRKLTEEEV
jgi:hypothetical protein